MAQTTAPPYTSEQIVPHHEALAGEGVIRPGYDPRLTNEDLAPLKHQTWSSYNFSAFWMSDVHSVWSSTSHIVPAQEPLFMSATRTAAGRRGWARALPSQQAPRRRSPR
jgi:hypothetical protein